MTEILTSTNAGLARITLNRPAALHALNTQMCRDMIAALQSWREDESVRVVMIDHAEGTRGFCAGGDIRMLAESGKGDGAEARAFFYTEYQLNHLLFTYPKPIVALIDGVTMGGGVGISMPARFRIATENTTYAMPASPRTTCRRKFSPPRARKSPAPRKRTNPNARSIAAWKR